MHEVVLLLGSNIEPVKYIKEAYDLLKKRVTLIKVSSVWQSDAVGSDGPPFLNVALLVATHLDQSTLVDEILHPIEQQLKRVRTEDKNAPRTIDIDIIIWDKKLIDQKLFTYAHLAVPTSEVIPHFVSPFNQSLKEVAKKLMKSTIIEQRDDLLLLPFWIC